MAISEFANEYHNKMFNGKESGLTKTDPQLVEIFENFVDEVVNSDDLDDETRYLAILAALIGVQGLDEYKIMLSASLNFGITPIQVKETLYQSVAYLGMGRVYPFMNATNEIFQSLKIELPIQGQTENKIVNRREKGESAQVEIFGEHMRGFAESGDEYTRHINRWLCENCFGDYYTRGGLDYKQREMITFCFLLAQGGCEAQLTSHAAANIRIGNDKNLLVKIISQCLPYIGYPRSLNAINCLKAVN